MEKFITEQGASNYYLTDENGMGGFLNPPDHAEHFYSIIEKRGGHEVGSYSLSGAIESDWIPNAVKSIARYTLAKYPGNVTQDWIQSVYKYFAHSYSRDGIDRNVSNAVVFGKFWGNAEQERDANPYYHLGYLFVKKFDPNHAPRLDLIGKIQTIKAE